MDSDDDKTQGMKRQRVTQACDWCRKKKIKCDAERPSCKNCVNYHTKCVYSQVEKKPRRKKKAHMTELESRMSRIETLLEALVPATKKRKLRAEDAASDPGPQPEAAGNEDDEDEIESGHEEYEESKEGGSDDGEWAKEEDAPPTSFFISVGGENMDYSKLDKDDLFGISCRRGTQKYVSNGPPLVLFSTKGMQWLSEKSEDKTVSDKIAGIFNDMCEGQFRKIQILSEPIARPYPLDEALVRKCAAIHRMGPSVWRHVIKPDDVDKLIQAEFANDGSLCPNGYAEKLILNGLVTLVTSDISLFDSTITWTLDQIESITRSHLINTFYYRRRTMLLAPSMPLLQGLALMVISLQCSPSPHPVGLLVQQAIQLACELGLNRRECYAGLSAEESNRKRTLWWLIYAMDRDVAMKIGRPPTVSDIDVSTEHPSTLPVLDEEDNVVDVLKYLVDLFRVYQSVFEKLYSATATQKSPAELVRNVAFCDELLEKWRESLASDVQPKPDQVSTPKETEWTNIRSPCFYRSTMVIYLHFNYYRLLLMIHRVIAYRPSWVNMTINDGCKDKSGTNSVTSSPNGIVPGAANTASAARYPRLFNSMEICSQGARTTLSLFLNTHGWPIKLMWGALYFVASAYITLIIKCVTKPKHASTRYDLNLLGEVQRLIESLNSSAADELDSSLIMTTFMRYMNSIAHNIVSKAQSQSQASSTSSSPASSFAHPGDQPQRKSLPTSIHNLVEKPRMPEQHPVNGAGTSPYGSSDLNMLVNIADQTPSAQVGNVGQGQEFYQQPSSASSDGSVADVSMMHSLFQFPTFLYTWDQDFTSIPWNAST